MTGPETFDVSHMNSRRALTLAGRALRLHCPNCGSRNLWRSWLHMRPACPVCGLHFERGEQGYVVGAYMFNIVAAELVFAAIFIAVLFATWPAPPWTFLQYGGALLMVVLPFVFYPFSKTLFLAMDLWVRPQGYEAAELDAAPGGDGGGAGAGDSPSR